jgi:ABC-type transport system involved in multi-copper enzyme maturation permease subunit
MIRIFNKELLTVILSGRFVCALAASLLLFSLGSWFFVADFAAAPQPPPHRSTVRTQIYKPADPLGFCLHDVEAKAWITPGSQGQVSAATQERNHLLPPYEYLDWAFLVSVAIGVVTIVLTFSAISGEKEDGTLRQILSNGVPRTTVYLGKYLAYFAVSMLALLAGALASLTIVSVFGPAGIAWAHIGRLLVFLLLSGAYVSLVVLLSLFISGITYRPALSALLLLAIWSAGVFLVPGVSQLIVSRAWPIPSDLEMAGRLGPMMKADIWGSVNAVLDRVKSGELSSKEEVLRLTDEAFIEGQKKLVELREDIARARQARTEATRRISRVSPAMAFRYGAEALLNLGYAGLRGFRDDVRRYAGVYNQYVTTKMGKLVVSSTWGFSTGTRVAGEYLNISSPRAEEYTGDMADFPVYYPSRPSVTEALTSAAPDLVILLGWNVLLFAAGILVFLRYDVR